MAQKEENSQQLNNVPYPDEEFGFPPDMLEAPSGMPTWALELDSSPVDEADALLAKPEEHPEIALTPPPDLPEILPKLQTEPAAESLAPPPDLPAVLAEPHADLVDESLEPPPDLPAVLAEPHADLVDESLEPPPDLPAVLAEPHTDLVDESLEPPPDLPAALISGDDSKSSSIIDFPDPLSNSLPTGSPTWAKALGQDLRPEASDNNSPAMADKQPSQKNVVQWSTNPKLKKPKLDFTAVESDENTESTDTEKTAVSLLKTSHQPPSLEDFSSLPTRPDHGATASEESLLPASEPHYLSEPLNIANNQVIPADKDSTSPSTAETTPVVPKLLVLINRDQVETNGHSQPLEAMIANIDTQIQGSNNVFVLPTQAATADKDISTNRFMVFALGQTKYAIPLDNVVEMATIPQITYVPNVPEWVRGVANMRGDILAIMELRSFIGLPSLEQRDTGRMLVVRSRRHNLITGLIVDSVSGMRALSLENIKSFSSPVANRIEEFLQGLHNQDNETLVVLDLERLLSSPEVQQFQLN